MNKTEKNLSITLIAAFILLFMISILIYFSKPPLSDTFIQWNSRTFLEYRTEPNRTESNRIEPNRTEPNRTESNSIELVRISSIEPNRIFSIFRCFFEFGSIRSNRHLHLFWIIFNHSTLKPHLTNKLCIYFIIFNLP